MENLPGAAFSPRIELGALKWYEGDTFELQLTLDLTDQDGEEITIAPTDTVSVVFSDENGDAVKAFEFTEVENNTVTLGFDSSVTALFPKGRYSYDVRYSAAERTTIANDNEVTVE